ncbi:unnamed protein product [Closterium sp. Naga37s-1]|nr:unnamed protein product [Closterium sp. Naga37s-1]
MWATRARWFRPSAHSGTPDVQPRKSREREPARPASESVVRGRRGEREEACSGGPVARGQQDHRPRVHPNPSSFDRSKPARPAGELATGERDAPHASGPAGAAASFLETSAVRGKERDAVAKGASKRASARGASASGACLGGLVDLRTLGSARGGSQNASGERKALASFRRQHMMRFLGDANLVVLQLHGQALCCGRPQAGLVDEGDDEEGEEGEEEERGEERGEDEGEGSGLDEAVSSLGDMGEEDERKEKADVDISGTMDARGGLTGESQGCTLVTKESGKSRDVALLAKTKVREVAASPPRATPFATPATTSARLRSSRSRFEQVLSDWAASARMAADEVAQGLDACDGSRNEGPELELRSAGSSGKRSSSLAKGEEVRRLDAICGAMSGEEVSQLTGTVSGTDVDQRAATAPVVGDGPQVAPAGSSDGRTGRDDGRTGRGDGRTGRSDGNDRRTGDDPAHASSRSDAYASVMPQQSVQAETKGEGGGMLAGVETGAGPTCVGGETCAEHSKAVVARENRGCGDERLTDACADGVRDCSGGNSGSGVDVIAISECKDAPLKLEGSNAAPRRAGATTSASHRPGALLSWRWVRVNPTLTAAQHVRCAAATCASASRAADCAMRRARRSLKAAGGVGGGKERRGVVARGDGAGVVGRVAVMGVVAVMAMVGSDEGLTKGGWAQRCFWRSSGCSRGVLPIMMAHAAPLDPSQWPGLRDMKAQWGSIIPSITDTWVENGDCSNYNNVHCNAAGFVTQLDLTNRRLTGSLPGTIGVFVDLQYFYMDSNSLSGSLPSTFSKLISLKEFNANHNELSGPLPEHIGALTALQQLRLQENQLEGPFPSSFTQLTALTSCEIYNNQITGPLPDALGSVSKLLAFRANNNLISGPLPSTLTTMTTLSYLELQNNNLSGPLPSNLGTITTLKTLNLAHNAFSGSLPKQWTTPDIYMIDISDNHLSGTIPDDMTGLCSLLSHSLFPVGLHSPSFQAPSFQAPSFQAPSFQAPSFQAPSFHSPYFHSPPFHSPSFHSPPFHSPPFHSPPFHSPPFHSPPFHSPSFHSPPFYSPPFHPPPFYSPPFYSPPFQTPPFHPPPFYSPPFYFPPIRPPPSPAT